MARSNDIPMVANRKSSLPIVYGDTPSFLGVQKLNSHDEGEKPDVVVMGVPWEGTVTWGSYSGCELAPKSIRHASARYGGYLPEYDIDLFDHLTLLDAGDVTVIPGDPEKTMRMVRGKAREIYETGAVPFSFGGDHSYTPEIVEALCERTEGKVGIIHFDAHLDNMEHFGGDRLARCGPLYRLARIPGVNSSRIVHIGIRGPRNAPTQFAFARETGAKVFTIREVRSLGMDKIIELAVEWAYSGTKAVYVTICSDVIDAGYNPGGPADFDGLTPHELFGALHRFGREGVGGLDFVEVYPLQDANGFSSHLAVWAMIHALVGMASRKAGGRES